MTKSWRIALRSQRELIAKKPRQEDKTVEITEILRRGITTEKSVKLQELNKYTFEVALKATKIDIRRAVETIFNVKVVSVNTMRMPGKKKMIRRRGAAPRPVEAR